MSRILVLAQSGFGKTFSLGAIPQLKHKGLDPTKTYIISVTSKPLTFPGSQASYRLAKPNDISSGNRYITNNPEKVAELLEQLLLSPFENIVIDDFNYLMQDFYMANAQKGGWETPKKIGSFIGKIFTVMEQYVNISKNIIILAHGEEIMKPDGRSYVKLKTTGKMVDDYVTPEGKFDITLVGKSRYDMSKKRVIKEFITNEDEFISSPKSPYGMFDELYIPNDMGYVVQKVKEYYQ